MNKLQKNILLSVAAALGITGIYCIITAYNQALAYNTVLSATDAAALIQSSTSDVSNSIIPDETTANADANKGTDGTGIGDNPTVASDTKSFSVGNQVAIVTAQVVHTVASIPSDLGFPVGAATWDENSDGTWTDDSTGNVYSANSITSPLLGVENIDGNGYVTPAGAVVNYDSSNPTSYDPNNPNNVPALP